MTETSKPRFGTFIYTEETIGPRAIYGWQGYVLDRKTNLKHPLRYVYVDYELQGEVGYASTAAFDTKADLLAAAQRKARQLLRA